MKIIWKVAPVPTGRYRSFEERGWPSAEYENQEPAAWISCPGKEYIPSEVKIGNHPPLILFIADYSERSNGGNCPWTRKRVKKSFLTLKETKEWFAEFIKKNPVIAKKDD